VPDPIPASEKAIVSVAEMSRMVGLSRSRFYQLVEQGVFPEPKRSGKQRPYYDSEGQELCLGVRRKNCGINGKPILFYARRVEARTIAQRRVPSRPVSFARPKKSHPRASPLASSLIDGLRQLGVADLTDQKVAEAVNACFPQGVGGKPNEELLLIVFRYLVRQNSTE
jgi:predicted DNA-binding transcriptional regulator AlpA